MEPRIEAIRVAQTWQVAPRTDQGLLHGVLGPVGVTEDESCGRVQPTDRGACKRLEGVMIAPLRPLHELSLHGGLTDLCAPFGRAVQYVARGCPNRSRRSRSIQEWRCVPRGGADRCSGRRTGSCTIGRDVRTDRAALGAARDQLPVARGAFGLHRGICPGRFAPGIRGRDRRRPFHGAHHVQGHAGVPIDALDQRGDRRRRRLVQRLDRPGIDGLLGPRPAPRGPARGRCPRGAHRAARCSMPRRSRASAP